MATSSNFSTSNQYIKYRIVVTELSSSIADNTSTVNVKVDAWRTNSGYTTYGTGTCYCSIDGTSYSQSISSSQRITHNSHTVLFDRTVTIQHGEDGKKNLYIQAKISHSQFSSSYNGFTVTLTDIPRKATITAVQNFTDEGNPTIGYMNPAGLAVDVLEACISLDGSTASIPYRACEKLGSSYQFNLTTAERNLLLASIPNSNTGTVYFILKTEIAGNTYTDVKQASFSVVNANPVITGASYKDNYSATVAITGDNQKIIQNKSDLLFAIASITAQKSASLTSLEITLNSITQTQSLSGASESNVSLDFGVINVAEDISATIKITDSRGNTTETTLNISVYSWKAPTALCKATRQANYYDLTTVYADADISSLGGHNQLTITWLYKEKDAQTYTTGGTLADQGSATVNLDREKAWDVKFEIADLFATTSYILPVEVGIPIFFIDTEKRACAVGDLPDESECLAVNRKLVIKNPSLHETLGALWTKGLDLTNPNSFRSCSLFLYDQAGKALVTLDGNENNGHEYGELTIRNEDQKILAWLGQSSGFGGWLGLYNNNSQLGAELYVISDGGLFRLYNGDGDDIVSIYSNVANGGGGWRLSNKAGNHIAICHAYGNDEDGALLLYDANGNETIRARGKDGTIALNHIKQSGGTVELMNDEQMSSGQKQFTNDGFSSITVIAKVTSGGSFNVTSIPMMFLDSSDKRFCISDEASYVTFTISVSNGTITLKFYSRNSSGFLVACYGTY